VRLLRSRVVAFGVALALAATLVLEVVTLRRDGGLPHAPSGAAALVRRFGVAVTSFDHRRLDADLARVLALGTPGFERDFRSAMGSDFTARIAANRTVSVGAVVAGPQIQRVDRDRASLLVLLDQRIAAEGSDRPPDVVRVALLVTVQRGAGDPLVAAVQVL
jgi:hypothetical protein